MQSCVQSPELVVSATEVIFEVCKVDVEVIALRLADGVDEVVGRTVMYIVLVDVLVVLMVDESEDDSEGETEMTTVFVEVGVVFKG